MNEKLKEIIPQISAVPGQGKLDAAALLEAHKHPAVTSIRSNPLKPAAIFRGLQQVPWCDNGYYLEERPVFTLDPLFHAGAYYVQEASSMFVDHAFRNLVRKEAPLRVLDLCAAPGGKSTLLASLLEPEDLLIANEVIQTRASILAENLSRWGQMNTWVTNNDPKDFGALPHYFDVMLIDAPCTGSGLWRKDADALDEWSAEHVKLCSERQKRILADALPALKKGGILLYATCSYSAEENEEIADWLYEQLHLEPVSVPSFPDWHINITHSHRHQASGYRFYPWKLRGEGFFLTAFRKRGVHEPETVMRKDKSKNKPGQSKAKEETGRWQSWLDADFRAIEREEGTYYALHSSHVTEREQLLPFLRIKKTGTALGRIAGKDVVPDHELALSVHLAPSVARMELDRDEALAFLKKEEVRKEQEQKGWIAAAYEGLPLGWGKWLPNRMNNYFPKNWRIRMDIK